MEALVSLFDKYVETFFVGFLLVAPVILIANGNSIANRFIETIIHFFGFESDSRNSQTLKVIIIFLTIFSSGLFFKSLTYLVFGSIHEKVIAYTECKYHTIKKDGNCKEFELSGKDYLLGLLSNEDKCREQNYLNHLSKQAKWFVLQRESYNSQIESIGRNITISQGFMFSAIVIVVVSLGRLVFSLRDKTDFLNMTICFLIGVAFYWLCLNTWWSLEEIYHMRIIVSEQFLDKENDQK